MKNLCALALLGAVSLVFAQTDPRYAGPPARYADGTIKRSTYQRALFVQMHPCPATGEVTGSCANWQVDHVIPLFCNGADLPVNMAWMPVAIKTCAASTGIPCKDRWEAKVYCSPQVLVR